MKFALASDLHLTYGQIFLDNKHGSDVLILAGDIYEACDLPDHHDIEHQINQFFSHINRQFPLVLWVSGNHEHYGSVLRNTNARIKRWLSESPFKNVQHLEKETVHVGGVAIHGTTLWTDINGQNPSDMHLVQVGLNDYNYITKEHGVPIRAAHTVSEHLQSLGWLDSAYIEGYPNLVVTHHHPCYVSIPAQYIGNPLNHAYASKLDDFILDRQDIIGWCSGHIHTPVDYYVGETRVLCNPRGYNKYEKRSKEFQLKFFETYLCEETGRTKIGVIND